MRRGIIFDKRRILYTICFALFCLIDQRTKTGSVFTGSVESFRDMTGIVLAVLLLSHAHFGDFRKHKIIYLCWSLLCLTGGVLFCLFGEGLAIFLNDRIVISISVFLVGLSLLRLLLEKQFAALNKKTACLWLVMMVLMVASRSEYLWPLTYLIMFGSFYLTDYSAEERGHLFHGMLNGLILAFFLMQGWCFAFRPYDRVRYAGVYSNCNMNALFYMEVLAAVLVKLLCVTKENYNRFVKGFYWLGAGALYAFIFMTIGRTAWITAFLLGILFLAAMRYLLQKKNFLKNGLLLILCFCLAFPLVFSAVRYLPPVFHHPVWFFGEWSEDKVHSWDSWDSEKYVNLDDFLEAAMGRIADSVESLTARMTLTVRAQGLEEDPRYEAAVWKDSSMERDSIAIRLEVYSHYLRGLNLWGHPYSEQGFQLTPTYWIGHAHNIYLQYGTDFGIIVLVLYIVLVIWTVILLTRNFLRSRDVKFLGWLFLFLIPNVFGMFECSWGVGCLSITMMFIAWREVICDEEEA